MTAYIAGWNMPGYLPESEPAEFDTIAEAWDYIVDEIGTCRVEVLGAPYSETELELLAFDAATIDRARPGTFQLAGLAYWVEAAEPDLDDVRECGGCEDAENHPHAFDCERG